jgi:hypothetical protein
MACPARSRDRDLAGQRGVAGYLVDRGRLGHRPCLLEFLVDSDDVGGRITTRWNAAPARP